MKVFEYIDDEDMSSDALPGDAVIDGDDAGVEWQSVRCVTVPSERRHINDGFIPRPLPYDLVALLWNHKSGENLSTARCHQIAQRALHRLLREMARGLCDMGDMGDDFSMDRALQLVRQADEQLLEKMAHKRNKRADTDVVGGGGTDAPDSED